MVFSQLLEVGIHMVNFFHLVTLQLLVPSLELWPTIHPFHVILLVRYAFRLFRAFTSKP